MSALNSTLAAHPIFEMLTPNEKAQISNHTSLESYKKNSFLKDSNTNSPSIFLLLEGYVKRGQYSVLGKEFNSKIFIANDLFGLGSLFNNNHDNCFFYQSITPITVVCIKKNFILQLMKSNTNFSIQLLEQTINKIADIEQNQFNLVFSNIEGRVAYFLLKLAKDFGRMIGNEILIEHPLTQQDMANFIGLTRQTVNQAFTQFKDKGYIYTPDRKKILIKNKSLIEQIAMY